MELPRNPTRPVRIGSVTIGDGNPIVVQSMTATKTAEIDAGERNKTWSHQSGAPRNRAGRLALFAS